MHQTLARIETTLKQLHAVNEIPQ